jgi:hypothetical protein
MNPIPEKIWVDHHMSEIQGHEARQQLAAGRAILAPMVEQHPNREQWKDGLATLDRDIESWRTSHASSAVTEIRETQE